MPTTATSDWSGTGALSANWTTANGCTTGDLVSGAWRANNDPEANWWNPVTPPNNQWAETVLGTMIGGTDGLGPMIRQAAAADSRYCAYASTVAVEILKTVSGGYSTVGSTAAAAASGNTIYIEAQGTSLVVKKNGSNIITTTDSSLTSGRFGLFGSDDGVTFPTATSWQAGDFTAAGGGSPLRRPMHARYRMYHNQPEFVEQNGLYLPQRKLYLGRAA